MKKLLFHPLTVLLITFAYFLILLSLKKTNKKVYISQQNIQSLESEVKQLEQEIASNNKELYHLDQDFVKEKIVRDQLLKQKEGEIIINLPIQELKKPKQNLQEKQIPLKEWLALFNWRWKQKSNN